MAANAFFTCTGHGDTESRRKTSRKLRVSVPPWLRRSESYVNRLLSYVLVVLVAAGAAGHASAQVNNYVVGPQDQLLFTVWEEQALSGKFTVEADGSFSFPLKSAPVGAWSLGATFSIGT